MPIATRTFRIFVSSTFEDLKEERDALQREVFPKLRKLCEQHGARFQAIDLRWGVRDEAAIDQKTLEICLREIERCQGTGIKPNFIVLLGQRYGWRPLPSRIDASEFETVRGHITTREERALVEDWYQRDDNAVPAEYLLQPRTRECADARRWQALEARLHGILLDAARTAGLSLDALVKYEASATHQEIQKGLGTTAEDRRHVFALCRQAPDEDCDPDLVRLRNLLRDRLAAQNLLTYAPGDFSTLCRDAEWALRAVIESEAAGFESKSALAMEIEAHDAFARERALVFGREDVLGAIAEYIRVGGGWPLVLRGTSGSGKSAVMAQASERATLDSPLGIVVRRFIGASPDSTGGLTLLRSLAEQLGQAYHVEGGLPTEFTALEKTFRQRLASATADRPLVLFIDALDQLAADDPAQPLGWLSGTLPPYCCVVVSTTALALPPQDFTLIELEPMSPADAAAALDYWLRQARRQLQPAQHQQLLAAFGRCGLPLFLKLAFEEARGWPSYRPPTHCRIGEGVEGALATLLDRLSRRSNHGPFLVGRSLGYLAAARHGLTEDEVLDVLSEDGDVWNEFESGAHYQPPERRLPVVVWSRLYAEIEPYLTERRVHATYLLGFFHRQVHDFVAARFLSGEDGIQRHRALVRYFRRQPIWLKEGVPYLRRASELPHQQLRAQMWPEVEATLTDLEFIEAKAQGGMVDDLLSDYSRCRSVWPGAQDNAQQAEIAAYLVQLVSASDRLPSPPRALCRVRAEAACSLEPPQQPIERILRWGQFVSDFRAQLAEGEPAFQCASNSTDRLISEDQSVALAARGTQPWFRLINRSSPPPRRHLATRLGTEGQEIYAMALSADGRVAVSACLGLSIWDTETGVRRRVLGGGNIVALAITPDASWAIAGEMDGSLWLWNLSTGERSPVAESSTQCFAVAITPDRRRVLSGHRDGLRISDLAAGRTRVIGQSGLFSALAMTPSGRRAVLATGALQTGQRVMAFDLDQESVYDSLNEWVPFVSALAMTPDGRRIIFSSENELRVFDGGLATPSRFLRGHTDHVRSAALTPDGRYAVTGGDDCAVRLWDLDTGESRLVGEHTGLVHAVAISADGRLAISGSRGDWREWAGPAHVWDLQAREEHVRPAAHDGMVTVATVFPGSAIAVSGGLDKTIRCWNLKTGEARKHLGHSEPVECLAPWPEEYSVISGSSDGMLQVWNVRSGVSRELTGQAPRDWLDKVPLPFFLNTPSIPVNWVAVVAITADRTRVVAAGRAVEVWDFEGGACVPLAGHEVPVKGLAVSPDGRYAITGDERGTFRLCDLATGLGRAMFPSLKGGINDIAMAPDGRFFVAACQDESLYIGDIAAGHIEPLCSVGHNPLAIELASGGRWALSGDWLCDTRTRQVVRNGIARAVAYRGRDFAPLPDGVHVLFGTGSGRVHLWNIPEARRVASVSTGKGTIETLAQGFPWVIVGAEHGGVTLLEIKAFELAHPPMVTATRLWRFARTASTGTWDDRLTAACYWCHSRFPMGEPVLEAISEITDSAALQLNESPCMKIDARTWQDPRLLFACPSCRQPLLSTPFVVDNLSRPVVRDMESW